MDLLTVQDVAVILKVSNSLVYGLVASRKIACHRIGQGRGAIRICRNDLEEFLATCRTEKTEPTARLPRPKLKHLKL